MRTVEFNKKSDNIGQDRGDFMEDSKIIDLYFERNERALEYTEAKYSKLLHHVAFCILHNMPDCEECVNDTYMKAWESMPPERPTYLGAFLSRITRNLSINRYIKNKSRNKMLTTEKVFEEMEDCIPESTLPISDDVALRDAINSFLESLSEMPRKIFVKRYFYMMSVKEISIDTSTSVSNVKVSLMRTREKLKAHLEKAGISI